MKLLFESSLAHYCARFFYCIMSGYKRFSSLNRGLLCITFPNQHLNVFHLFLEKLSLFIPLQ